MAYDSTDWRVEFYSRVRGDSPPLEFIKGLEKRYRAKIARYIKLLKQTGVRLGMPYAGPVEGPIWELRPRPYRLLYFAHSRQRFFILVAFRKTTNATPREYIDLAFQRMDDVMERRP